MEETKMKLTKKIVSLLMALCLVLGLAACCTQGSETKDPANDNPPVSDNAPTTNPMTAISLEKRSGNFRCQLWQ